jgi:hypothetical protein
MNVLQKKKKFLLGGASASIAHISQYIYIRSGFIGKEVKLLCLYSQVFVVNETYRAGQALHPFALVLYSNIQSLSSCTLGLYLIQVLSIMFCIA